METLAILSPRTASFSSGTLTIKLKTGSAIANDIIAAIDIDGTFVASNAAPDNGTGMISAATDPSFINVTSGGGDPVKARLEISPHGDNNDLLIEAKLDGEYYRDLLKMTKGIAGGTALAKTFGISIDLRNLQIIFRAIIMGIDTRAVGYIIGDGYSMTRERLEGLLELKLNEVPNRVDYLYQDIAREIVSAYDRTGSVTVIDEIIEKHKFILSKEILSPRLLSPLLIAWYLILKEIEIRNLRLILKMTLDNIDIEEIKNYLVLPS